MQRKSTDKHHIFWYHRDYSKGYAKKLRDFWYCTIEIPRDSLHRQIHYEVSHIPVPAIYNIKEAIEQLKLLDATHVLHSDDNFQIRLKVLMALFDECEDGTYQALLKQYLIVCKFYNKDPHI